MNEINNDLEAENMVIGAIFLEPDVVFDLSLTANHFHSARNRLIFQAIKELAEKEIPTDIMTVTNQLGNQIENAGGVSYLTDLSLSVPTAENILFYENIVLQQFQKRRMMTAAANYLNNPTEEGSEALYQTYIELFETESSKEITKTDVLYGIFNEMSEDQGMMKGISTGFADLDAMTGGLDGGDLIIVAARPSMGKTAFALNLAMQCCVDGGCASIFSLEMPEKQLTKRMLSAISAIEGAKWRNPYRMFNDRDHQKASRAIGQYETWDMYIHDDSRQTVADIRANIRATSRSHPHQKQLVIIDYLQLMTPMGTFERHDLAIGKMTSELKQIARQFSVPIILLSQLNRSVEQRQNKRPMLSDLRDSGSIEQDADLVMLLYRDDYYDKSLQTNNIVEINIAKQRNGPVGSIPLTFWKEYSKFCEPK
ncbi:replicative DNA helicase [Bacillus sp. FJAT-52991]|uniref:Replicative DNA helicase n=1 Tax=Bacillus kandeliae TaxID=3129297 RepID=A0ABZ2N1U2_9BACI